MTIRPIVEGHGEIEAVPVLLRRLIAEAQFYGLSVLKPIRRTRTQFLRKNDVQAAVSLVLLGAGCDVILFVLDADDECPLERASQIKNWADETAAGRAHCEVVVANREYEAWFLASMESLRGKAGIREDARYDDDCEAVRGAKEALERLMVPNRFYNERIDQPSLTDQLDLKVTFEKSRSFRRLVKAFANTTVALGRNCQFPQPCSGACECSLCKAVGLAY